MSKPTENLLTALYSSKEFWDIFRTRTQVLVLAIMDDVGMLSTYLPIDTNMRITASFAPP